MKILIVCKKFYPDQNPRAFRSFELARELAAQGHEVKVYTAITGYDYSAIEKECGFSVSNIGKLRFVKMQRDKPNKTTFFDKLLNSLLGRLVHFPETELTYRIPKALEQERGYDMLISIALPFSVHWGCALALGNNKELAKTWVADCGDPFMGNKFTSYPFYFRYVERWLCRKVDYLTVPTIDSINAYEKDFHQKIRVIPQGFRFDNITDYKNVNVKPTFAYAGMLYKDKRDPKLFLEYLSSIDKDFKFILYTKSVELITPYMSKLGDRVEIRNLIPRNELLKEFSKMDFLVNFENSVVEQTPSKLIDYALTGLPILSIPSNKVVTTVVDEFLSGNYRNRFIVKNVEQYDITNVTKEFLKLHFEKQSVLLKSSF